jgi:anti-sigma B factor antagonist
MGALKPRIRVEYTDDATIIAFVDERILDQTDIQDLQASILSVVEQGEHMNFILDFSNVRFLSSAVLGLLLRISKRVYEKDGRLRLCSIDPKIYQIFKITRLTKIFDIYKDLETATRDLAAED